jgi:NAD(P)-dependent dehydrogenase (short-subunit alcohol dehydrogenase family)
MKELQGKTAFVTGASRGIGRGIAVSLGAAGALVAVNYARNAEAAQEVVKIIESKGGQAFAVQGDVEADDAGAKFAASLKTEFAKRGQHALDILVSNVGRAEAGKIAATDAQLFDRMIRVNLRAPFLVTSALIPFLRDGGRVITITSTAPRIGTPDFAAYSIGKGALESFNRILARELAPRRITVNAVSPGYTRTDQVAAVLADPAKVKMLEDFTMLGRIGEPEDIGDFVRAVASDAGRWVTGQWIEVSGGFRV